MALTRRAFAAATAAGVVAPTIARAKECPAAGMDWMTMSLEARNLAYFNVAHVGADFARLKTESWTAALKNLREQRPKHLDLAYGSGERTKWDPGGWSPGLKIWKYSSGIRDTHDNKQTYASFA